jgi:ubiquinone biosynthesis protein
VRKEARHLALPGRRRTPQDVDATRRRRARDVRLALEGLGPLYVKVGQILSTRPDIVSAEMVREFGELHDAVTVQPFSVFEPVLREELGEDWRATFRDVDTDAPLGAASLAQVYAATTADGTPVVIKVQRPGVASLVHEDARLFRRFARLLAKCAPRFTSVVDVEAMLDLLFDAMRAELDFRVEAQNMDRARREVVDFKYLDVPEVLLATRRVMLQSRAPGCSVRDADPADFTAEERIGIGRDLLAFMYRGFFTTRVFHADPHPGNVFVHPGERASLIDWGMVGRIDRRTSQAILLVLLNVAMNDGQGLARAWTEMGRAIPGADLPGFQTDMEALVPIVASASLDELNFGVTLTTVLTSSTKRGIRTNPAIALLGKAFANVEGSIRYLAPELSITETFRDELRDIVLDLVDDTFSEEQVARTALEVITSGSAVVQQIHTALQSLAENRLKIHVSQAFRLDEMNRRRRTVLVTVALLAGAWWRRRPLREPCRLPER